MVRSWMRAQDKQCSTVWESPHPRVTTTTTEEEQEQEVVEEEVATGGLTRVSTDNLSTNNITTKPVNLILSEL